MPPKRKSDARDEVEDEDVVAVPEAESSKPAPAKKARTTKTAGASSSKSKEKEKAEPKHWSEIVLEGEEDGHVPVYDDCNDIRRKIRELQKTPGFKVTHWLKEIGGINNNSMGRFMKDSGPNAGATNGTYVAAYKYFEKVRIAEGKKKTPKRLRNEDEHPNGFPLENRRRMWVLAAR
ncbi:hypothetical protein BOTBODRAFT_27553 [Botryobasidium botryosum FD-172 SS1]|uniref:DUF7726 domain-containing protein n=1 Tax=Botryobasidium botryosum (strain FD-172 SS1) TaxID=930990 RepID=A0A067MWL6_BOTB1|nr:hypothetical protein BOTBODRAFT_27553 [Botryobasidium botryosum FD-172 SS1]